MDGIAGEMRLLNSIRRIQMDEEFEKADPDEIILKLKEVLAFLQKKQKEGKI